MKKIISFLLFIPFCFSVKAQQKDYDTAAIVILDRMSDVIGDLSSCSYVLNTTTDRAYGENMETSFGKNEVYMVGPNKMLINNHNDKGHRSFFYNGSKMNIYYFDENNYSSVDAPSTIVGTMDTLHTVYGIDFPAADFFFPSFTDDLLNYCSKIDYLGLTKVDDKECFHIMAKAKDMIIQIWVTNDATTLPQKMLINYTGSKDVQRYEASFCDWKLNPTLPDVMFEFSPPPNSTAIYLMPKTSN